MRSAGFTRCRRFQRIVVEVLEGRALLSTVASVSTFEIQPTGVRAVSHVATPRGQSANAGDALQLSGQYAKALFSSATGAVVSNYAKALLRGNGKELKSLGSSSAVQQLNAGFQGAASSSQAQAVHSSLNDLGHSISNEFKKIFG